MKPSEFYIGVVDVFAIMLPGAIATAILAPHMQHLIVGPLIPALTTGTERWAVFLVSAYFLGHLIFLVGAYLDPLYDFVRKRRHPDSDTSAYAVATTVREAMMPPSDHAAINTFQWSRSVLIACAPSAAEDVHRLEADSKFFRSLVVVSLMTAITFVVSGHVLEGALALVVVVPCFARYYERRRKSTTQAYQHVITLHRLGRLSAGDQRA